MGIVSGRVGRRKTDLTPTVPSPRESTPSSRGKSKASPGSAYSMSRLDILAQPRRSKLAQVNNGVEGVQTDLSRSMSTLPQGGLRKATTSRSMLQLGAPLPPPRPTRAEKLRRQATQARSHSLDQPPSPGKSSLLTATLLFQFSTLPQSSAILMLNETFSICIVGCVH